MPKIKVCCEKITPMKGEVKIKETQSDHKISPFKGCHKENSKNSQDVKNKIIPMKTDLKPISGKKPGK